MEEDNSISKLIKAKSKIGAANESLDLTVHNSALYDSTTNFVDDTPP